MIWKLKKQIFVGRGRIMKEGIHTKDWLKLVNELRKELPPEWFEVVMDILEKYSTNYI